MHGPGLQPSQDTAYAHLLGLYLGDGCIAELARTVELRIYCDARQEGLIAQARESLARVMPERPVHRRRHGRGCVVVSVYSPEWPVLLPQHGPGRKHERHIALAGWQVDLVRRLPWAFLRGLLHSDGCRSINRVRTILPSGRAAVYEYPRWYFTNASEDILGLFGWACDLVGVDWTRSGPRRISVSRRASVALLDEHVGPKA